MLTTAIKCITTFFCSFYAEQKLIPNAKKFRIDVAVSKALVLTLFTIIYKLFVNSNYVLFPFLLFVICECVFSNCIKLSVSLSIISYGVNQMIIALLYAIISFLFSCFWNSFGALPTFWVVIIASILQPIVVYRLFKVKRLQKGMPFLLSTKFVNSGFILGVIVFICLLLCSIFGPRKHSNIVIFEFIIIAMFIPLIVWWRHKIKESYLAYLREFELTQLHQQINDLSADNERLSRIVHKDNKLVSAMASSVLTLLEKAPEYDQEEFLAQCDSLHKELSELSLHRQELLVSTTAEVSPLGNSHKLVESVLSYEVKNARHSGICTKYNIDNNFMAAIETYLTDEELAHILADMIQNAIIAMKATAQQNLLIHLHMINGNPTISVMDSGTAFSPEVLQNLGLAPCSTHLNEGGSGIGLMDIWQLKVKSKASLVIKELSQPGDYTKQLSIIFDGKNKYVVFTNRKQELTKMINRFDMYIENI